MSGSFRTDLSFEMRFMRGNRSHKTGDPQSVQGDKKRLWAKLEVQAENMRGICQSSNLTHGSEVALTLLL